MTITDHAQLRRLYCSEFRYLDFDDAEILERIPFGYLGWVFVIGHPDNATYEWVVVHEPLGGADPYTAGEQDIDHSDQGYGSRALALRDGLNRALED